MRPHAEHFVLGRRVMLLSNLTRASALQVLDLPVGFVRGCSACWNPVELLCHDQAGFSAPSSIVYVHALVSVAKTVYAWAQIINKAAAWAEVQSLASFDNGNTLTNTLYWVATRP